MSDHNVFISHRHEDDSLIQTLKDLLAGRGCDLRDSSVNAATPNNANAEGYIKEILADRIRWAGKILVIVSPETRTSEWVDWEIEYAKRFPDKRIIGVWSPDAGGCEIPGPLKMYADAMVEWDAEAIIEAISGSDSWRDPTGTPRELQAILRIGC
ncbi:hypothetical protein GCM10027047_14570 [Rhodococcus aerolatus]